MYTYGLDGTLGLLLAPEAELGRGLHGVASTPTLSAYAAAHSPAGYSSELLVTQDDEVQRLFFSVDGAGRVVEHDARTRTTRWLFVPPGGTAASVARCFVLANDSALSVFSPADSFATHAGFTALPVPSTPPPLPRYELAECVPFSLSPGAAEEWVAAPWPSVALAPRVGRAAPRYGAWCGTRRGGAHDCCSGKPCEACADGEAGKQCLQACPPADELDAACAAHAGCASAAGWAEPCRPGGAACACDAALGEAVRAAKCDSASCKVHATVRRSLRMLEVA